ncbi:phage terminase large subunit [Odoribacter laneus]|jgi:hypothetical protein|uniref:phage terminase large subunit n=1 Tax=Odoribacter laneus TaxID=626933 RepID=UPI003FF130D8
MTVRETLIEKAYAKYELKKRAAKIDFWQYCLFHDYKFFTERPFLEIVADAFMRVHESYKKGESRSLAVSMPPRAGKSYITTLFITFMIGNFPEESVMRNCCSDQLYQKLSYDTRDIIRSAKFKELFPDVCLKGDKQNVKGWSVEQARQVTYFGGGVGGTVIGFGASLLDITDDLYKSIEDARSETINEKTWSWKQGTHDSRREKNACHIDIGTRWSNRDVLGRLEESNAYNEIIRIPALDEKNESFCPAVHSTEYYLKLKETLDPEIFSAEYMQEPIEVKGLLFPKTELNFYDPARTDLSKAVYTIIQIDPADTGHDFVCIHASVLDGNVYVDTIICNNTGIDYNVPASIQLILERKPSFLAIEGNSGWIQTAVDIRNDIWDKNGSIDIKIFKEGANKPGKIIGQAYFIKKKFWFRADYESIPEYKNAITKLTGYLRNSTGQKDDVPDVLADISRHLRRNMLIE